MKIPGFVDLQVNGYDGVDFSNPDLTQDNFARACRKLLNTGTAAFLPTLITCPSDVYRRNLTVIAQVMDWPEFQNRLLGFHLEGPFISPDSGACGAHNKEWIQESDIGFFNRLLEWSQNKIKLITIAAEAKGAGELARYVSGKDVVVSLGHQLAGEKDIQRLVKAGARALTHLGNGLPWKLHRHKNPLWAGLGCDDLIAMIITDGHHLPDSIIKSIIRTKGISNIIITSDASPISGLAPGRYDTLGKNVILHPSGKISDSQTEYMVGSSANMLKCMNYLAPLKLVSIKELLQMGLYNPLKLIKHALEDIPHEKSICYDESIGGFSL